jgi:hypothetical protein
MAEAASVPHDDNIRYYELHRWLDPRFKQRATMLTPLTPGEIRAVLQLRLLSIRRFPIPYAGLYGSIAPWGFSLRRSALAPRRLQARYGESSVGTSLTMEFGTSRWGWVRLVIYLIFWPVLMLSAALQLDSVSLANPIDSLWTDGEVFWEQPLVTIVILIFGLEAVASYVRDSWRSRDDVSFYRRYLADAIDAHEVSDMP